MRQAPRSPLSFKLQRVANVSEHPPPSTRLMSCAHIANRQLSRIIGASPPLNAPAQALSGDETKRRMALVNADREIVRKIMTEPGPRWEPQSPARAENAANFFRGRPMHLSSKACGEAGAMPLESRL